MCRVADSKFGVEVGKHYGLWTVLGCPFSVGRSRWRVVVQCECGTVSTVDCNSISTGDTEGCRGCATRKVHSRHGESGIARSDLYTVWANMKVRCLNPRNPAFKDYGGRGVIICDEWSRSYESFRDWAMDNGYSDDKEIDRYPDNDGNYEPGNCRFVTSKQNNRNRRDNAIITAFGESKCITAWAEDDRCVVKKSTLYRRLFISTAKEMPEDAMTRPCRKHREYIRK